MVTRRFAYFGMIVLFLAGSLAGWGNGEFRAQKADAQRVYVAENIAKFERDAFYRGFYTTCMLFGENAFYASHAEAIEVCNSVVADARSNNMRINLYWSEGYEPE